MGKASSDLDRLVEMWRPRLAEVTSDPAASSGAADRLGSASERDQVFALAEALKGAITATFPPESKELALALAMVDDGGSMSTGRAAPAATRVFDLIRAMYPASGALDPKAMDKRRAELAALLDALEDMLDGLFVAVTAPDRAPGGPARG